MELTAKEFLPRFLMHIPPRYFNTKRGYGFLSNGRKGRLIPKLKQLIKELKESIRNKASKLITISDVKPSHESLLIKALGKMFPDQSIRKCKKCGYQMEYISTWECFSLFGPPKGAYP